MRNRSSSVRRPPGRAGHAIGIALGGMALGLIGVSAEAATPKNALVMAWNIDAITTFDPAQIGEVVTNELVLNTCDTLVDFDPADETKLIPKFAERWDVSEDRKQITLHLREGAVFPSGNPVTAADAAWSLQRAVKLNFGNAATLTEYGFVKETVDQQIVATDDKTLVLKLDKPYPATLILQAIVANRVATVLDSKLLKSKEVDGDFGNKHLVNKTECVGPYKLRQWTAGETVVLEANDNYYGEKPKLKRIIIRHVGEAGTQRLLVSQGDADVARDLVPEDLRDLEKSQDVKVMKTFRPQLFYWGFNNADPIFAKEKVRLAMRYLIDYDALAKTVIAYDGIPRASFVPTNSFGALDEEQGQPFKLDLEKAKQLLTEAGYADGFEINLYLGISPYGAPIAQHVQENASKVGIKINIERMANAQLFSKVRGREFQTAMLSWQTAVPDAHGMASRQIYNPDNSAEAKATMYPSWRGAYYSEEANKAIDAALFEQDPEKRKEMYHTLQRDMMEKGPVAYIFHSYNVAGVRKEVKDWTWNGFRTYYSRFSK